MALKTILSVAPNGARRQKTDHAGVPVTPAEITADVLACAKAGAAIAHIHARRPDGQATQDVEVYREIAARIREQSDIIIQISIGGRGFSVHELLEPLALQPEMASFPLRIINDRERDPLAEIRSMALAMKAHHARPELDASQLAMLDGALALNAEGAFEAPLCFGFVLQDTESMAQAAQALIAYTERVPRGSHWWAMKGGDHALGTAALAISLGGHVRTGFEDTILDFDKSRRAPSNASLVDRLAALSCQLGRDPATPAEARAMLALAPDRTPPRV